MPICRARFTPGRRQSKTPIPMRNVDQKSIETVFSIAIYPHTGDKWQSKTLFLAIFYPLSLPGRVAQSVTCLATDACLTADLGVASSIPVRSHTFVEIDHEIFSTVILLPSADSFKKGCCQLQAKVCARITG